MAKVKNWDEFQHFKDRTPPWIKLYRYVLDDPEWHELSGDDAKTLVMLWLIASEDKTMTGTLPNAKTLAFRLRTTEVKINQTLTKLKHWLFLDDINMISECNQHDAPEERRDRGETEAKPIKKRSSERTLPDDFAISERVIKWAKEKGFNNLQDHYDNFVLAAKSRNYKYTDWDSAFMKAITANWANVVNKKPNGVVL